MEETELKGSTIKIKNNLTVLEHPNDRFGYLFTRYILLIIGVFLNVEKYLTIYLVFF